MIGKGRNTKRPRLQSVKEKKNNLPAYPLYPAKNDIYNKNKEEKDIDPEEVSKNKVYIENDKVGKLNEKNFIDDFSGRDLDVPGSESDDDQKNTGNEDEENEYYSLGGDDHNNLDEDKGE